MADNVAVTAGTGTTIAADDIGGVKFQRMKIVLGADGTNDGDVASGNPLPTNTTQIGGVAPTMNTGVVGTGVQRVTLATDVNVPTNIAQMNGVAVTMGNGVSGTGVQRVTLASDSTGLVKLAAGTAAVGEVKSVGITVRVTGAKTRPNDTNAYAAGDVVNESTSAGTNITFSSCARANGGSGVIQQAILVDSANQSTKGSFELWLFKVTPGADNDNAVFTPTDSECLDAVAVIPFTSVYVGDATSGAGGNCLLTSAPVSIPFVCDAADTALYGVLVARNAYTPVANEVFTIALKILQD